MRKSVLAAITLASIAAPFTGANADGPCSDVVIFSSPVGANPNGVRCLVDPTGAEGGVDTRLIMPGSTAVSGRFISADLGPVQGHLHGMGVDIVADFTRASGATYYSFALQNVDASKVNDGCITLDVFQGVDAEGNKIIVDTGSFHGINGTC